MGLGSLTVCSHGVFMEGNVSSGGPSLLHRQADRRLPGKGPVARSHELGRVAEPEEQPVTFELRSQLMFL